MIYQKFSVIICVLIFCTISCYAGVFTQPAARHPDYPGKCFDTLTRRPMLPNKEYKPKGICAVMTCQIETYTIDIETCPYIDMPGCEELPADPKRVYPKCCPQYLCKDERTGNNLIFDLTTI